MAKSNVSTRRTRGPSIARETAKGHPTAYGVCKSLWSHRGPVVNKDPKLGDVGEIKKSSALSILKGLDKEAAAPFTVKRVGKALHLVAA